jgi:hypothetical protein
MMMRLRHYYGRMHCLIMPQVAAWQSEQAVPFGSHCVSGWNFTGITGDAMTPKGRSGLFYSCSCRMEARLETTSRM